MDIEALYLFLGVFVASLGMLVVLKHLFKNKSYEEVVAEQRQQTNALFNNQSKHKEKDKKQKKAQKKSKEKKPVETTTDADEVSDHTEQADICKKEIASEVKVETKSNHSHVEFKEPSVIEEVVLENKRKPRRESVKPILVNRDSSSEVVVADAAAVPHANHFEESHPKDELELLNACSHHVKDEKSMTENKKKKQVDKKSKHQVNENISKKDKDKSETVVPQLKEEKHEQQEIKEELLVSTPAPIVQNGVAPPVKDKKKKKSELNILTQNHEKIAANANMPQLIALVKKADMSKEEAQTLVDILLNKQQDAPSNNSEWSEGKGDPMQKLKKQLAEKTDKVIELENSQKGIHKKIQEIRAEQVSDRNMFTQNMKELQDKCNTLQLEKQSFDQQMENMKRKCQQLQDAGSEESAKARQMMEEFKALQVRCQQSDMIAEGLNCEINSKNMQIMQHQVEMENAMKDMKLKCETILATERQQLTHEFEKRMEVMQNNEMIHNKELQSMKKQIDEANMQIAQLNNDLRSFQETRMLLHEKDKKIAEQTNSYKNLNHQLLKVEEELKKAYEAKTNGSIEQGKQHEMAINQLSTDLKNARNLLDEREKTCQQKSLEVEELKNKNNDLRQKNWKVMEALNAAETQSTALNIEKQKLTAQIAAIPPSEDPKVTRAKFLKRVFPSIDSVAQELTDEEWNKAVQEAVREHIVAMIPPVVLPALPVKSTAGDAELEKLRSEVATYQQIIDQSESILLKLQNDVEQEQIRWSKELKNKDESISRLSEELELKEEELRHKNDISMEKLVPRLPSPDSSAASSVSDISEKKKKKKKKNKSNGVAN